MKYWIGTLVAVLTLLAHAGDAPVNPAAPPVYPPNAALQYWIAISALSEISAEDKKHFGRAFNAAPGEDRANQVNRLDRALKALHRGAQIPHASWGIDISLEGPFTEVPHVSKSRELSRAALFAARDHFNRGRAREGLDLLLDTLALARHVSRDGTILARLVESAITNMALDALCQEIPRIPRDELLKLESRFAALPPSTLISDSIQSERRCTEWYRDNLNHPDKAALFRMFAADLEKVEDKVEMLRIFASREAFDAELLKLRPFYAALEAAMSAPYVDFEDAWEKVAASVETAGVLARLHAPVFARTRTSLDRTALQLAATRAGIQIALHGEAAVQNARDPFGDGPFTYTKLADGFELTSRLVADNKPIKTLFGESARKRPPAQPNPPEAIRPPAPPNPGEF